MQKYYCISKTHGKTSPSCFVVLCCPQRGPARCPKNTIVAKFGFLLVFLSPATGLQKSLHPSLMQCSDASVNKACRNKWWLMAATKLALHFASVERKFLELCFKCTESWEDPVVLEMKTYSEDPSNTLVRIFKSFKTQIQIFMFADLAHFLTRSQRERTFFHGIKFLQK